MMSALSNAGGDDRASRWLVFGSLALNLFFIGAGGALLVRHSMTPGAPANPPINRSVGGRIGRIAATLPTADATIFRDTFKADSTRIEAAQAALRREQDAVRTTLRAEPFDAGAMRAAMANTRAARQSFDVILHDMVATASAKMSVAGRNKLADWPGSRDNSATVGQKQ
jgi:uncharacterized membrane protein